MTTMTIPAPATDKQVAFITRLREDRAMTDTNRASLDAALERGLGKYEASQMIEWLLALPKQAAPAPKAQDVSEGMWLVGGDVTTGRIFKVQHSQHSDRLYAKELIDGSFEYVRGAARLLATEGRKLTLDEAKQYGALYGTCCVCGRTLTDETSIAAGIGPICASKGF